jgi:hypothetical protein
VLAAIGELLKLDEDFFEQRVRLMVRSERQSAFVFGAEFSLLLLAVLCASTTGVVLGRIWPVDKIRVKTSHIDQML